MARRLPKARAVGDQLHPLGAEPGDAGFDRAPFGAGIQAFAARHRARLGHAQVPRNTGAGANVGKRLLADRLMVMTQGRVVRALSINPDSSKAL